MIDTGPAELVLMAAVARRYYVLGEAKTEIAEKMGISRFKVARLIDAARAEGLVRIEIVRRGEIDAGLSAQLQERFGLTYAIVLDTTSGDAVALRGLLGRAASRLLVEVLSPDDVLGLPWSRHVRAMVDAVDDGLPPVEVVQLTGALALADEDSSAVDIVRRAARAGGGQPHLFFAPFVLDDAESAAAIRRQPAVAEAMAQISRVTVALMGVGAWRSGGSTIHDAASPDEQKDLARLGVVGEAAGVCFDREGHEVRSGLSERLITLSGDELRAIPDVIAIASGPDKAEAVASAMRGGLVNGVVCDRDLGAALLRRADPTSTHA